MYFARPATAPPLAPASVTTSAMALGIGRPRWHERQRTRTGAPGAPAPAVGPAPAGLPTTAGIITLIESRRRIICRATRFSRFSSEAQSTRPPAPVTWQYVHSTPSDSLKAFIVCTTDAHDASLGNTCRFVIGAAGCWPPACDAVMAVTPRIRRLA